MIVWETKGQDPGNGALDLWYKSDSGRKAGLQVSSTAAQFSSFSKAEQYPAAPSDIKKFCLPWDPCPAQSFTESSTGCVA